MDNSFYEKITQLSIVKGQLSNEDFKSYKSLITKITDHLQKTHKLLSEDYYISIYMSIGMSLGLLFGMLVFDNIALGLPIGMSLGIAIGAGIDADNKKKGKTI
jgi:hypothetical protein